MATPLATDPLLVLCSCPAGPVADILAKSLVEQGLAACVQQLPGVQSVYRWEGEVQSDTEVLLLIKTAADCWDRLEAAVRKGHPYELPELIAVPITAGLPGYLDWIRDSTR